MTTQNEVKNDERYKVLWNAGFVGLVEQMGSDETIEDSARVAYGRGTRKSTETRGLLRYLMKHKHSSPFEMGELRFHLKIPIFVMRQFVRHRTASLNEYSGRYSEMSDEMYLPEKWRKQSISNKQGSSENFPDSEEAKKQGGNFGSGWCSCKICKKKYIGSSIIGLCADCLEDGPVTNQELTADAKGITKDSYDVYESYVERGVAKELARIVLPVANYTELYWKIDLHNFFHFLKLRTDEHAQQEIRELANAMLELAKPYFPISFEAWEDYEQNAVTLSRMEFELLKKMLCNIPFYLDSKPESCSEREWKDFLNRWGIELS